MHLTARREHLLLLLHVFLLLLLLLYLLFFHFTFSSSLVVDISNEARDFMTAKYLQFLRLYA